MEILNTKHASLRALVAEVLRHLPESELMVLDWWDGDPHALALAVRSDPARRAYVSSAPDVNGLYMLSCEFTARLDSEPYHNIESDPFSDLSALATTIAEHLGSANEQLLLPALAAVAARSRRSRAAYYMIALQQHCGR